MAFQVIREPEFAKRVKNRRIRLGLNQAQCAKRMNISRQHWNNWEIGFCKPKGQRLQTMAAVLQCDAAWLQHGNGSEIEERIDNVMFMMRVVVRDLDHIHKALAGLAMTHPAMPEAK